MMCLNFSLIEIIKTHLCMNDNDLQSISTIDQPHKYIRELEAELRESERERHLLTQEFIDYRSSKDSRSHYIYKEHPLMGGFYFCYNKHGPGVTHDPSLATPVDSRCYSVINATDISLSHDLSHDRKALLETLYKIDDDLQECTLDEGKALSYVGEIRTWAVEHNIDVDVERLVKWWNKTEWKVT